MEPKIPKQTNWLMVGGKYIKTNNSPLKIFELQYQGKKEWIIANSIIQALQIHIGCTGGSINDFMASDDIFEIPHSQWNRLMIKNAKFNSDDPGDWCIASIKQLMKENPKPAIITGTMY